MQAALAPWGGGRSPRYEQRRAARESRVKYAPEWSDAAAAAVLEHLEAGKQSMSMSAFCTNWLTDPLKQAASIARLRLSPADRSLVSSILEIAHEKAVKATEEGRMPQMVKSFLKPLRERRSHRTSVTELVVRPAADGPPSFHSWLSAHPSVDRLRDLKKSRRILKGLKNWPLKWLKKTGVICYE